MHHCTIIVHGIPHILEYMYMHHDLCAHCQCVEGILEHITIAIAMQTHAAQYHISGNMSDMCANNENERLQWKPNQAHSALGHVQ